MPDMREDEVEGVVEGEQDDHLTARAEEVGAWKKLPIRKCSRCKEMLASDRFGKNQHYCRPCQLAARREWIRKQPIEKRRWYNRNTDVKKRVQARRRARHWQLRLEMIAAYGGSCVCCGEIYPQFLTLEHLNGGGRAEMRKFHKAGALYKDLKRRGWPSEYTVLCFNCNSAKGHFGVCPHVGKTQ